MGGAAGARGGVKSVMGRGEGVGEEGCARSVAHRSIFDEVSRCAVRLLAKLLDPFELLLL